MNSQLWSDRSSIAFELRVLPSDFGKVIGRQGRTANAIRTILAGGASFAGLTKVGAFGSSVVQGT